MVDQDLRPYPPEIDPQRALDGERIFDAIQKDSAQFLEKQRELGDQMKAALIDRIAQIDALGLVPLIRAEEVEADEDEESILSVGFTVFSDQDEIIDPFGEFSDDESGDVDVSDEFEEREKNGVEGMPGFWVRHKDVDGDENVTGVFLDSEGNLWIDNEFGESGVEIETFFRNEALGVPLEEYPVYYHEALMALSQAAEAGLGISNERNKMSIEEAAQLKKLQIDRDNAIYGGMEEFDEPSANALMIRIHLLKDDVANGSAISEAQFENMLRRLFEAQELMFNGGLEEILGGEELNLMAGAFINDLDPEVARKVRDLVGLMLSSADSDSLYILRRAFRVSFQTEPENKEILRALALSNQRLRAVGLGSWVRALNTPTDYETEDGREISGKEIRDWLFSDPKPQVEK